MWPKSVKMAPSSDLGCGSLEKSSVTVTESGYYKYCKPDTDSNRKHVLNSYCILGSQHSTKQLCLICRNK